MSEYQLLQVLNDDIENVICQQKNSNIYHVGWIFFKINLMENIFDINHQRKHWFKSD